MNLGSSAGDRSNMRATLFVNMFDGRGFTLAGEVRAPRIRILVQHGNVLRRVCKLLLPRRDFSFAIVPYSAQKQYFYRSTDFGADKLQKEIQCTDTADFESIPKMQFHDALPGRSDGQVHISAGKIRVGATEIPPLSHWSGDHIATVDVDCFGALPEHSRALQADVDDIDQPLQFSEGVEAGRFVFCVNGQSPSFTQACPLVLRVWNDSREVFLGIAPKEQSPRVNESEGGVVVIGGWNPKVTQAGLKLLTLRAL